MLQYTIPRATLNLMTSLATTIGKRLSQARLLPRQLFGRHFNGSSKPILSTIPSENAILAGIQGYTGEVLLIQGEKDDVVPCESGLKIIQTASKAKTKVIVAPEDIR